MWRGANAIWLTPLSYVVICLPAALVLLAGAKLLPRLLTPGRVAWLAAFVPLFFAAWTFYPRLDRYAVLLLAMGIATVTMRTLVARSVPARRRLLGLGVKAVVLLLVAGAVINAASWFRQRRELAGLPAASPEAPNVLLLVLDTVRGASLSLFGETPATTPRLAEFARGGTVFRGAFSASPWTLPSHLSMLTGQYPHLFDADWRRASTRTWPTLAGFMKERGYATAGFVANVAYCSRETGIARDFLHYEDYVVSLAELLISSSAGRFFLTNTRLRNLTGYHDIVGRRRAPHINEAFLDWLPRRGKRPFFAFLNYYEAHEPYLPPPPFDTLFGPAGPRRLAGTVQGMRLAFPPNRPRWSAEEQAAEKRAYDASLAYLDSEIGKLLDQLRSDGLLEKTIVIITADHGEQFGEHGLFTHGNSLYAQNTQVPLIVVYPRRVTPGAVVENPVTTADLPATIVDLAGLGAGPPFPGAPMLSARDRARPILGDVLPLEDTSAPVRLRGQLRSLVTDSLHWLLNADGSEELYAWRIDGAESTNLVGPSNASLRAALRARLDSTLRTNLSGREISSPKP